MNWALFVDTDSLYLDIRKKFGPRARMDYMNLPFYIASNFKDISSFSEKQAMVMRHGKDWPPFAASLEKFGYDVILTDRGMQPITISSKVLAFTQNNTGVVLVTVSARVAPLVEIVRGANGEIRVVTFDEVAEENQSFFSETEKNVLLMDSSWLWRTGD